MPAMNGRACAHTHMHQRTQVARSWQGKGVAADVSAAFAWYSKAAEQVRTHTHKHTQAHTRTAFRPTHPTNPPRPVAAHCASQPCGGARDAWCVCGVWYSAGTQALPAVPQWQPVLRFPSGSPCRAQGDAIAAFNVGVCYERGEGVEPRPDLAIEWCARAHTHTPPRSLLRAWHA
jgi:TPR repeat protein